ncbi:MAG: phage major capsid protein, partial [Helicobacter sp.]|nr:phage major capsid protein [Helicobacter sp.]
MQNTIPKTFALDLQECAFDEVNHTISFIALSANPTIKRKGFFGDFYVSIDTDKVQFSAKTFYLDHNISFESAIGNIIEFKKDDSGNFKVKVQFHPDIEQSLNAFKKYQKGLSNSVSVGFGDCEIVEKDKINNLPHYHIAQGEIVELSAVWQGADPNAVISSFCKNRESTNHTTNFQKEIEMPQTPNSQQGDSMNDTNTQIQANLSEFQTLKARKEEEAQIIEL